MTTILKLDFLPCDLNRYIHAMNANRFMGAKIKREDTEAVYWACQTQGLQPIKGRVHIDFVWTVKNKRKDPDNTSFGKKSILDGLVMAHVLDNDGWDDISGFTDSFVIGSEGVVVTIQQL
jgi:hypothetical protein